MATSYQSIFERFLSQINDKLYAELSTADTEEDLTAIMDMALTLFGVTDVNLNDRDDTTKQFNIEVPVRLQKLIAIAMKNEWCGRQIYRIDLVKQKMLQSDFKMTSQQAHLDTLLKMQRQAEREFYRKAINKSYSTSEGKTKWSTLVGDS